MGSGDGDVLELGRLLRGEREAEGEHAVLIAGRQAVAGDAAGEPHAVLECSVVVAVVSSEIVDGVLVGRDGLVLVSMAVLVGTAVTCAFGALLGGGVFGTARYDEVALRAFVDHLDGEVLLFEPGGRRAELAHGSVPTDSLSPSLTHTRGTQELQLMMARSSAKDWFPRQGAGAAHHGKDPSPEASWSSASPAFARFRGANAHDSVRDTRALAPACCSIPGTHIPQEAPILSIRSLLG
eukprot:CAMPEP_0173469400 /NCGR_PEP_ID=MMETSP1357-20121228/77339_1 /TAXON_ID=77926 /ORGANISM="Hemiselmis rufescens, Strain PCC563" /LENGTH=237 /DNA_ID=CAMNT_0014437641 /DNA_START=198 /DNA_END=909 /DNA_ORIENTATION=+